MIVGPNGCGKSNITDAVLWAMGEQSPLAVRGQSMQDMIFAGGDGESPRRYAEVEVVLASDDDSEYPTHPPLRVRGRRGRMRDRVFLRFRSGADWTRNGEGEYRLNGARCRLVDVIEVLRTRTSATRCTP